jgi:hypothetical protein
MFIQVKEKMTLSPAPFATKTCLPQIHQSESETHIAELESRHHLRTRLNESHDLFIHKLPPESASLIFIMALPQQNLEFPWDSGSYCQEI